MKCNCKAVELILGAIILIFVFWPTNNLSDWIIAISAILLIVHAFICKNCRSGYCEPPSEKPAKSQLKKSKKK